MITLALDMVACVPMRGTQPVQTWRPETPEVTCSPASMQDPHDVAHWSPGSRAALEASLDHGDLPVVRALGCTVDVLPRCRAKTTLASDLEGECTGATHVVRHAAVGVELAPLSLHGFDLTGTWIGVMTQPKGPYEAYDVTMDLVQDGDRVTGFTRLTTTDEVYWGKLRFEGRLQGNTLFFADAEIVDDNLGLFLGWCTKGGYLLVEPKDEHLSGPWKAGMCNPGTLEVQRVFAMKDGVRVPLRSVRR